MEISRILKPDGILIAPTWRKRLIHCRAVQRKKLASEPIPFEATLVAAFPNATQALLDFEKGRFLYALTTSKIMATLVSPKIMCYSIARYSMDLLD